MKLLKSFIAASALAYIAAVPLAANATLVLRLTDGLTTVSVVDGGAGDWNAAAGAITFIGGVGNFNINVSTALGDAATAFAGIHLDSVSNSLGAGSLEIAMTETGLSFGAAGPTRLVAGFGGIAGGTIQGRLYVDDNDIEFATDMLVYDSGERGSGPFAASGSNVVSLTDPFSMTILVNIAHTIGNATSFNFDARVPEPSILALLGLGLAGLGFSRRKKA